MVDAIRGVITLVAETEGVQERWIVLSSFSYCADRQ